MNDPPLFANRGDLVAFVKEVRAYERLDDAIDAVCDLLRAQARAINESPVLEKPCDCEIYQTCDKCRTTVRPAEATPKEKP